MSDGPHRSLPMRPGWKKAAKRADTPAYVATEVTGAALQALEEDWRAEVPDTCLRKLGEVCAEQKQLSLLGDPRAAELAALRQQFNGLGSLGGVLVDGAQQALADGKSGEEALREAVEDALKDRLQRTARQIEEHYYRHSAARGFNMRERLAEALGNASLDEAMGRILRVGDRPASRSDKQKGLDDGVALP